MRDEQDVDPGALLKQTTDVAVRNENLLPLLVGAAIVVLGGMTLLLLPPLFLGFTKMCLDMARGRRVDWRDISAGVGGFVRAVVTALLLGAAMLLVSWTLVGPVVLAGLFSFAFPLLADRPDLSPVEALKESFRLANRHRGIVALATLASGGVLVLLGATMLGLIPATAFSTLLFVLLYLRLTGGGRDGPPPSVL